MIEFLKKINRFVLYGIVGVVAAFAVLSDFLMLTNTTAYTMGSGSASLVVSVLLFSVPLLALFAKLMVFVSYRIDLVIFARRSGLLYPFPIVYPDYEVTLCAFFALGLLLGGSVHLPSLFLPSLSSVLSAARTVVFWGCIVAAVAFLHKKYAHDYDKKSLAFSLVMLPLVLLSVSLVIALVEVIR